MTTFNVEALTDKVIIDAIAEQYGGEDLEGQERFEDGLRKICKLSDEGKDLFALKLKENNISFSFKKVEDLIEEYAIHHAHAWADAIKRVAE